jgi:hypothetical protein
MGWDDLLTGDRVDSDDSEIKWVDRRHDIRIIARVPGRFSLADRRDSKGERRVFSCRAINLSSQAIALATPITGKLGDRVIAHIDHLGKLDGKIIRLLERGFVISINATDDERQKLIAKIEWLEKFKDLDISDRRAERRYIPEAPHSQIMLADGKSETCLVVDYSATGVAVSADTVPAVGTVLAVGKIVGRVVRHFEGGFAVQFVERQNHEDVEAKLAMTR